ncbi:hypothetical protein P7C73_g3251, partial [Tremellales sp. Uapishka_1]
MHLPGHAIVAVYAAFTVICASPLAKRGGGKAGISYPIQELDAGPVAQFFVDGSKLDWWFNWNKDILNVMPSTSPALVINAEFVPMMFDHTCPTNSNPLQTGYTQLLGYNEPDQGSGVATGEAASSAAVDWTTMVDLVRATNPAAQFISPGIAKAAEGDFTWFDGFFDGICPGWQTTGLAKCAMAPSALALHVYTKSVTTFQTQITAYHDRYGLDIWITEFCADYDDSRADLKLSSTDDILFSVFSYQLLSASSFFRDMFADPNLGKATGPPIPISLTSSDLELFLDFIHLKSPPPASDWSQYDRVLTLCDQLGCEIVADRIHFRLHEYVHQSPWKAFCIASHHHLPSLATSALKSMNMGFETFQLQHMDVRTASQMSLPYLLGLLRAMERCRGGFGADWDQVAREFKPVL